MLKIPLDWKLCSVNNLREYVNGIKELRGENNQLLLSYVKPYQPVTKATIAKWIKMILKSAGIDVNIYSEHSCRAAANSHTKKQGVSLSEIIKTAGLDFVISF